MAQPSVAAPDLAPIHVLIDNAETLVVEIQQTLERVSGFMGVGDEAPPEEPAASGANLQSRLVRTIQTAQYALSTLNHLETQLNYEAAQAAQPAPSRAITGPDAIAEPQYRR
jgi:hypothetical protein